MRNRATVASNLSPVALTVMAPAAVTMLIGLAIVVSWHARFESVLQISAGYPAMAYRSAVGLALTGLALLLLGVGRASLARITALIVAGASLLAAAEDILSIEIGIGRLLADPY